MKLSREFRTGLLVIVAAILSMFGYNYLKGSSLFGVERNFYVVYDNVEGLNPDATVTVNGLVVGRVKTIDLSDDASHLIVSFTIDKKDFNFSKSSKVRLYDSSIIGGKSLAIIPNYSDSSIAVDGDELQGEIEKGMMDVIADKVVPLGNDLSSVVIKVDTLLHSLNTILDDKHQKHLQQAIENVDNTIANLNKTSESLNTLLDNNHSKIDKSLANFEHTTENFAKLSDSLAQINVNLLAEEIENTISSLNSLVTSIEQGEGSLGKIMKDEALYNNLENASEELEMLLRDLRENPKRYVHFSIFGRKDKSKKTIEIELED